MSDLFIFFVGCVVTVMVASAVGLLLWGAAREPRETPVPGKQTPRKATSTAPERGASLATAESRSTS